ncbi:MAG TPA: NTP transferase domain-containing protein, partial [Burkholderiales bacterium]|nr:NTP transferase domain-containing protein [Burkholderiales bacterium]
MRDSSKNIARRTAASGVPRPSALAPRPWPVTGVILAGGLGRRMGGVDKGLQLLNGRPMAARVLSRLAPQVDEVLINANQNLER